MIPDPLSGARLRLIAIVLYLACGAVTCARASDVIQGKGERRIVSVGGPITEIVFALGKGDRVVAVDTSSVYPLEVTKLPQVGDQKTLSAESILALSPDLVLISVDGGSPRALEQLRAAGVQVDIIPDAATIEEAARRIESVGASLRDSPMAIKFADRLRADATLARERCCAAPNRHEPKAVLVYARGGGTVMLAGTGTPGAAMLELAGAQNAIAGFSGVEPLSAAALVEAAPDVIVIPARGLALLGGMQGLLDVSGVSETPAGRARRIVAIDDLLLFGPRLAVAIDELSRRFAEGETP